MHSPQQNGLWDILPATVISEITGTTILDGNHITYMKDFLIPGGVILYKGEKFSWIDRYKK